MMNKVLMKYILEILMIFGVCFVCYAIPYLIVMFIDVGTYWSLLMFTGGSAYVFILKWIEFTKFKKTVVIEFEKELKEQQEHYDNVINTFRNELIQRLTTKTKKGKGNDKE